MLVSIFHKCPNVAEEQPVGRVSNLRVVESLGSTARLGWTGVAGATQYRIIILNTESTLTDFIHYLIMNYFYIFFKLWMKTCLWKQCGCVFHVMSAGTEEIRIIPGNQTILDLRDLTVGVSYGVSVTALVGENEGDPITVYIKPGGLSSDTSVCFILFSCSCKQPFELQITKKNLICYIINLIKYSLAGFISLFPCFI